MQKTYGDAETNAAKAGRGIWQGEFVRPDIWRGQNPRPADTGNPAQNSVLAAYG